ncbi:MAG: methyltransferase type 11 [Zetaproteobacteria bacterium CG12_big_fil_rev_8_21_14_0_65_55_1124]|nr:MAG: hypothetical protein AUJ58_02085 [Zetaproteobacteria bacterium CG1_02_55_237]PIS18972.1 MAG: methyltransferase type 11 [Zetaproteobacteria bacterium CG08_land_8_20_14_0_20_55_17]PIW41895.1 MAG: methyltransferase type 11 [Zetaproteobacteria bacterium CG12_big_fil_rev_8_21_14_0_65_55_1124]PIY53511.1 MAG: methyltransferase type 11 [Zetaproteobacteria bacterium CG_4_10_14_0_8_um_filter_55_43]PIZ37380.1 MAG: methyltransferase type 11 [Zetaproteobacteria bacterium CG_4_10_14_0_2_um_filter_55_
MKHKTRRGKTPVSRAGNRLPAQAPAQINAVAECMNSGQLDVAEQQALDLTRDFPGHSHAWTMLGIVLAQQGKVEASLPALQKAVELMPGAAGTHANLGNAFRELGQFREAEACYSRAVALNPRHPDSYFMLGQVHRQLGNLQEAETSFRRVLTLQPDHQAARLAYVRCISLMRFKSFSPFLYTTTARALTEAWIRPTDLVGLACNLLAINPLISPFLGSADKPGRAIRKLCEGDRLGKLGRDPLFNAMLRSVPIYDEVLEQWLTDARLLLLQIAADSTGASKADASRLAFFGPLAEQCFINDYVFWCSQEEMQAATALRDSLVDAIENGPETVSPLQIVAVAAYFPLYSLNSDPKLLERSWPDGVRNLLIQQIREPQEEMALRSSIPSLTPIENDVSLAVQSQYEENPYPRWVKLPASIESVAVDAYLHSMFPEVLIASIERAAHPDVLIAGCGTGQHPIETAQLLKDSKVLAVDLSLASLSYAKRKSQEMGIENIEFARADILKLGTLNRSFDVIESVGVLHHLENPETGWKVLVSMLRPNGVMRLGFYSEIARRHVVRSRELIAGKGFAATADGIRQARPYLREVDLTETLGCAVRSTDFYSLSACRDLLFHVQEHRLTLEQIQDFIHANGLSFLGFTCEPMTLGDYHGRFPDDPAATNLKNWAVFEQENPDTFFDMYQFWLQKRH